MRKKICLKALVALMLVAALLCGTAMAATAKSARVFTGSMKVYDSTNGDRKLINTLTRGTSIKVEGITGNWAKVTYRGKTGYAQLKNIEFTGRIKAVTSKSSSIRFITKASYKRNTYYTATLAAGVPLELAGINGSYYLFYNEAHTAMGYIKKSAVRVDD